MHYEKELAFYFRQYNKQHKINSKYWRKQIHNMSIICYLQL